MDQRLHYLFVSDVATFSGVSYLRSHANADQMPLCALTHSLYTRDLLFGYCGLLMTAQPHDTIVVGSNAGRRTLENFLDASRDRLADFRRTSEGLPANPLIRDIAFGVDCPNDGELDYFRARLLLRIPHSVFAVLYFGRLTEEYKADLDPLLQAIFHLRASGLDAWLVLAGQSLEPTYIQHLERRVQALHLSGITVLLENPPEFLKTSIYAACDVMVSPSDCVQETFGLSILEAMAHARPVIASDWSGYRELIQEGKTGFLIRTLWCAAAAETASMLATLGRPISVAHYLAQRTIMDAGMLIDKLTLLAGNAELRTEMGNAGRARARAHYAWPEIAEQFLALWEEQLAIAKSVNLRRRQPMLENFSHYASAALKPDDLLLRITGTLDQADLDQHWHFQDPHRLAELQRLLDLVSRAPASIGELSYEGFSMDCILWLAKKGLCRIVPSVETAPFAL